MMNHRPTRKKEKRGAIRRISETYSKLLSNKIVLVFISLAAAFIVWAVMVASDGTLKRRKVFSDAPVGITGESTLISRGYIVTDNIQELMPSTYMIIEVTQANYERATASIYNPHFELSQITGEGENTLNLVFSSQVYGPVTYCEPNTLTVNVERYITRRVPVVVELSGKVPAGYYLRSYKADPVSLSVSGPQSLVNSVSRVVVYLDQSILTGERTSDRLSLAIELQQADGTQISSDKLTVTNQSVITSSLIVETELTPMKSLQIDANAFVTGTPAEGYRLEEIKLAETSLSVAAASEILDALTVITTDAPLDITGATETITGYVRIRRLTGIENTLPTEIGVTAVIEEETLTREMRNLSIGIKGQTTEKVRLTPTRTNVEFTGPYTFISALTSD
ncbi:MAG: hypothetical protein IJT77_06930, partial [Clostridia bacterium]|nr:hypothetical protein [Clostridia bacterium]